MPIRSLPDLSPVMSGEVTLIEWARRAEVNSAAQLRLYTEAVLDEIIAIIGDADDDAVTHIPDDPHADDPHAPEHERYQGWTMGHIIVHTTASAEEWAAYSSILARGIVYTAEPRLRYETDWHTIKTRAQLDQRLAESRRMRLAYLDTWPDEPQLNVYRAISERFVARNGSMNAVSAYLYGLKHELGHLDQLRDVARQARLAAVK